MLQKISPSDEGFKPYRKPWPPFMKMGHEGLLQHQTDYTQKDPETLCIHPASAIREKIITSNQIRKNQ
jgi:hypothetical protein